MVKIIASECSRFNECLVNNCPLEPNYPNMIVIDEDKEKVCTMEKQVRFKIGSKYSNILIYQGLTSREWAAKTRYNNLSDDEKAKLIEKGKQQLAILRGKQI